MAEKNHVSDYNWPNSEETHAHSFQAPVFEAAIQEAVNRQGVGKLARIIDVGCGNGAFASRLLLKGYEVSGCDASETGIELACKTWPHGNFVVASIYSDLTEKFGSEWDVVLSMDVLEHLYAPRDLINNFLNREVTLSSLRLTTGT